MCDRVHDRALLLEHMKGHVDDTGESVCLNGSDVDHDQQLNPHKDVDKENQKGRHFNCSLCGMSFSYNCVLKQHIKYKHSAIRGYQCDLCEKSFKASSALQTHKKLVHYPQFDFECKECDHKFRLRHELQRHVQTAHERQLKYSCDQCPKRFHLQDSLTRHRRTHNKDLKFGCDFCRFKTTQKRYLASHVER